MRVVRRKTRSKNKRRRAHIKKARNTHRRKQSGGNIPTISGSITNSPAKEFHFHNKYHIGDHIFNLKFFYKITDELIKRNIRVNYYYASTYDINTKINIPNAELERYVDSRVVTLKKIEEKPGDSIELWMGTKYDNLTSHYMCKYFPLHYGKIVDAMGIQDLKTDVSLFQDEKYLLPLYTSINSKYSDKYKDIDILIINEKPMGFQFQTFDNEKFNKMCRHLHSKYNIVTTSKVDVAIKCTRDDNLMLQDIGAISTHAKYIIAVHTGPITPCYNLYAKQSVKKWIIFIHEPVLCDEVKWSSHADVNDTAKIEEYMN